MDMVHTDQRLRRRGAEILEKAVSPGTCYALFLIALCAWIAHRVFASNSLLEPWIMQQTPFSYLFVDHRVMAVVLYCEVAKIWRGEYERNDAYAVIALALIMMGGLIRHVDHNHSMFLLLFCSRSFDLRKTMWVATAAVGICFCGMLVLTALGSVEDIVMYQGERVRHCMGFTYPLVPAQYAFCLTCALCWLRGEELTPVETALLIITNLSLLFITNSRLSSLLGVFVVVATMALKTSFFRTHMAGRLGRYVSWSYVIAVVATIIVPLLYLGCDAMGLSVMHRLNDALGYRIASSIRGVQTYGVSILGQTVPWVGNGLNGMGLNIHSQPYNYVDNLFLHMSMEDGIVMCAVFVFLCHAATRRYWRQGDYAAVIGLSATAAHMMIDDHAMVLCFNLLLLLVARTSKLLPQSSFS